MKLNWGRNHESIVLVAETASEVAIAEIIVRDMQAYQFTSTKKGQRIIGAKYTIIPEESNDP